MKINIYGVGRSGTKAIQLLLALSLLKKHGRIGINYEPFLWQDHLVKYYSIPGIREHERLPLLLNDQQSKKLKSAYLRGLAFYDHGITKFINGNGRMRFINGMMRPDATVLIMRDLYDVLNSVLPLRWDFLGKGLPKKNDWKRLISEVRSRFPRLLEKNPMRSSRTDKNAFYWYVMNKVALQQVRRMAAEGKNVHVLNFTKNMDASKLLNALKLPRPGMALRDLYGGLIHTGLFYRPMMRNRYRYHVVGKINNFLAYRGIRQGLHARRHGFLLEKRDSYDVSATRETAPHKRITKKLVARSEQYDALQQDVLDDLATLKKYII